jgi:hypothetical protein
MGTTQIEGVIENGNVKMCGMNEKCIQMFVSEL